MRLEHHAIVHLSDKELEPLIRNVEKDKRERLTGAAILIGRETPLNMHKDLLLHSNAKIRSIIKEMDEKRVDYDRTERGQIDPDSKQFLIQFSLFTESMFNSSSFLVNQADFSGLEDFDKFELKEKLQRIVDLL